jgi:hypothetical protein
VKTKDTKPPKDAFAFVLPVWAYWVGGVVILLALLIFVPLAIVALRKSRRRTRRARGPGDRRVAGAWDELVDGFGELGYRIPPVSTRSQVAVSLEAQSVQQGIPLEPGTLSGFAAETDEAVFDGSEVSHERSSHLWQRMEHTLASVSASAGWLRRRVAGYRFTRRRPASSE